MSDLIPPGRGTQYLLGDALRQPVWTALPDGSVDYANPFWLAYTGLSPEAALGAGWAAAVHPDDVPAIWARWEASVADGSSYEVEYRFRRADGEYRWHVARVAPMTDESGAVVRWAGTALDVHERRLAEDELRRRKEQAELAAVEREALLEREHAAREWAEATAATLSALNGVGRMLAAELDLDRLVQAVTDAATELTGARFGAFFYNVADERGESYTLYALSGADREAFAGFPMPRNTAVFGPTFRGEGVVRLADVTQDPRYGHNPPHHGPLRGHLPVVSYLAAPVVSRSGEVLGGLFFGHDLPGVFDGRAEEIAVGLAAHAAIAIDNARLYRDAQAAEARYRGLFEGVADAILVADDERRYVDANAAAIALLGYAKEELLGLRVDDVVAAGSAWGEAEFARFRRDGRWQGELELRRKDGTAVPVEVRATVVDLPGGAVNISALRDVSDRRAAEREQREFLEAVSHDIKTPLAVVLGQAQLLERRAQRGIVPDVAGLTRTATTIAAAAVRMDAQLGELQDAARLRAGHPLELRTGRVDLVALAELAVADAQAATGRHRLRVVGPASLVGSWDGPRIRRVLDNLLGNAVKYSPGGGAITVEIMQRSARRGRVGGARRARRGRRHPGGRPVPRLRALPPRVERRGPDRGDGGRTGRRPPDHRAARRIDRCRERGGPRQRLHRRPAPRTRLSLGVTRLLSGSTATATVDPAPYEPRRMLAGGSLVLRRRRDAALLSALPVDREPLRAQPRQEQRAQLVLAQAVQFVLGEEPREVVPHLLPGRLRRLGLVQDGEERAHRRADHRAHDPERLGAQRGELGPLPVAQLRRHRERVALAEGRLQPEQAIEELGGRDWAGGVGVLASGEALDEPVGRDRVGHRCTSVGHCYLRSAAGSPASTAHPSPSVVYSRRYAPGWRRMCARAASLGRRIRGASSARRGSSLGLSRAHTTRPDPG